MHRNFAYFALHSILYFLLLVQYVLFGACRIVVTIAGQLRLLIKLIILNKLQQKVNPFFSFFHFDGRS